MRTNLSVFRPSYSRSTSRFRANRLSCLLPLIENTLVCVWLLSIQVSLISNLVVLFRATHALSCITRRMRKMKRRNRRTPILKMASWWKRNINLKNRKVRRVLLSPLQIKRIEEGRVVNGILTTWLSTFSSMTRVNLTLVRIPSVRPTLPTPPSYQTLINS